MSPVHRSRTIKLTTLLLIGCALLLGVRSAPAATKYWTNTTAGGSFTAGNQWNPAGVPGIGDTAAFTNNPGVQQNITWGSDTTTDNGLFSSQHNNLRVLTIGSQTWFVTNSLVIGQNPGDLDYVRLQSGNLVITNAAGTATMFISSGGYFETYGSLTVDRLISTNGQFLGGFDPEGSSVVNILNGSRIVAQNHLYQGGGSWNFLGGTNVLQEAAVSSRLDMYGSLKASGPSTVVTNTQWLQLNGTGSTLLVTNGAKFYVGDRLNLGAANRDQSRVIVTGSNSTFTVGGDGFTYIGASASQSNELIVANGGVFNSSSFVVVGANSASTNNNRVTVTGTNSLMRTSILSVGINSYYPGVFGRGSALITDGGVLEANYLVSGTGTSGTITNRGGTYQFTMFNPEIVANSANSIVVTNGTISFRGITNAPVNQIGTQLTNMTFRGNNAYRLVNATNTAVASYTFQTNNAPGYASLVLDKGRFRATALTIGQGASLTGNGTVDSTSVTNLGTIAPGFSPGQLTFTGNLVLGASSRLEMQIGGTNSVDYDRLIVGGNVTVTGTLAIAMINAFSPTPGDTFTLIDNQGANAIIGQFDGLTNNAFIDASGNGSDAYFTIHYDGGIGLNDLVLIATIPEPSTTLLLLGAGVFVLRRRSR